MRGVVGEDFVREEFLGYDTGTFCYHTDGGKFFVKLNREADVSIFDIEARGLEELSYASTFRVPCVVRRGELEGGGSFLMMEYIEIYPLSLKYQEDFGRRLGELHCNVVGERFGFHGDNALGATTQANTWSDDWVSFFIMNRLEPQLRMIESRYDDSDLVIW